MRKYKKFNLLTIAAALFVIFFFGNCREDKVRLDPKAKAVGTPIPDEGQVSKDFDHAVNKIF